MFNNPEVKKSSFIIILTMLVTLVLSYVILTTYFESVKGEFIQDKAAMIGVVMGEHPELAEGLIPLITKEISAEDKAVGLAILNESGYNLSLEMELMPSLLDTFNGLLVIVLGIISAIFIVLFIMNAFQYKHIYTKIYHIAECSKRVLEGKYQMRLQEHGEGEFAKLTHSFNNMQMAIENNIRALEKEKKFLVDLLSDISHQLKTPLTSMMMFNELMQAKELQKEQRTLFLKNSEVQLYRMEWLIKSLLKLAKLDAGAIVFRKRVQSLNETVAQTVELMKGQATQANVQVHIEKSPIIAMEHDREWLSEALINIVKNGIEHTSPNGTIEIRIDESTFFYRIFLKDTGDGIPKNIIPHIFKRFYRTSNPNKGDSVGIGLSLSQSIVEGQGGTIEVESQVGKGTTFQLLFPKH
jgi:signal transduction histidine kinase